MDKNISFPKHLGIEVGSEEELIELLNESAKNDKGVYYTIDEVRKNVLSGKKHPGRITARIRA